VPTATAAGPALPAAARGPVESLEPEGGRLDARLAVVLAPPLPLELRGEVSLAGSRLSLHKLDPNLAGLDQTKVEDVTGLLRLDGDRLQIEGVRAKVRGAPVVVGGSIALGARPSGDGAVASGASSAAPDIVPRIGRPLPGAS